MARRGPDDAGSWSDERCTLTFRRLAVLDPTPAGSQPMRSRDGRFLLVYNGEVYNYLELRAELEGAGHTFTSSGDTEVVLQALATWGRDALDRFNGMFALALYDTQERRLLLARDHAGIKPLYILHTPQGLVFASQYDQLLAHPWRAGLSVDRDGLALYLRLGYVPAPYAVMQRTQMLEPGSWLTFDGEGRLERGTWFRFDRPPGRLLKGDEAVEAVEASLQAAVRRCLRSDVSLGTFLSGGVDSPLISALAAQILGSGSLKAFTLATGGDRHDESADAAHYARELGLDHVVEQVTPAAALSLLDDVVAACSEPFADYSIFPTLLISKAARRSVTVMLSGDGGDELFWGYPRRFGSVLRLAERFGEPYLLRSARWGAKKLLGVGSGHPNLRFRSIGDWYRAKHTHLSEPWLERIFPDLPAWPSCCSLFSYQGHALDETARWLRWNELVGHLSRVLLKVDRASMHHSLEVRVPLLDREVIDVALRLNWRTCLDPEREVGKRPLRAALARRVDHQTHAKRGFAVPMAEWLRGALRSHLEEYLLEADALLGLPLDRSAVGELIDRHDSGEDHAWGLWILLSLSLWERHHLARG